MWFRKKTELEKLIISYGKDQEVLLEFARFTGIPGKIEECTLEDIKAYYKAIVEPHNSLHRRLEMMKAVRKFFKYYRGENILKWQSVTDDPLKSVVINVMMEPMKKEEKNKVGRPPNMEMIKKVKLLREQAGLSFRKIGAAIGKDSRQAFMWYTASKKLNKVL